MRIILDTEKKTITVPWNYQKKLDDGYIDEIWKECMNNSDKCLVTGKAPTRK